MLPQCLGKADSILKFCGGHSAQLCGLLWTPLRPGEKQDLHELSRLASAAPAEEWAALFSTGLVLCVLWGVQLLGTAEGPHSVLTAVHLEAIQNQVTLPGSVCRGK